MNAYSSNSQIVRTYIACTIKNPHQRMLSSHTWHDDIVRINVTNFHPLILAIIHTCNMLVVHKIIYCNVSRALVCIPIVVCYLEIYVVVTMRSIWWAHKKSQETNFTFSYKSQPHLITHLHKLELYDEIKLPPSV